TLESNAKALDREISQVLFVLPPRHRDREYEETQSNQVVVGDCPIVPEVDDDLSLDPGKPSLEWSPPPALEVNKHIPKSNDHHYDSVQVERPRNERERERFQTIISSRVLIFDNAPCSCLCDSLNSCL